MTTTAMMMMVMMTRKTIIDFIIMQDNLKIPFNYKKQNESLADW